MRVVLAEDSVLLREGLVRLLAEAGHQVVAAVGDAPSLVEAVAAHHPDLAVVDVRMPPTHTDDGLQAALAARHSQPGLGLLVLSQYVEDSYAADLLASASGQGGTGGQGGRGGTGYLLKDRVADLDALAAALTTIAAGGTVLDPEVLAQVVSRRPREATAALSPREREVLELVAQGRSNAAIGEQLVISAGAVEKHIGSIFTKLDLAPSAADHRRVLAALVHLRART